MFLCSEGSPPDARTVWIENLAHDDGGGRTGCMTESAEGTFQSTWRKPGDMLSRGSAGLRLRL